MLRTGAVFGWTREGDTYDGVIIPGVPPAYPEPIAEPIAATGSTDSDAIEVVVARQNAVAGSVVLPDLEPVPRSEIDPDVFTDLRAVKGRRAAATLSLLAIAAAPALGQADSDAWVTGTVSCGMAGEATVEEGETQELDLYPARCYAQLSDPRVSGDWWSGVQQAWFWETGDHAMAFAPAEITWPDGTWVGTITHIADYTSDDAWTAPAWGVFEGVGAYEGWTFVISAPNQLDPQAEVSGIVYQGPPPPWGETLPLTPAG